MGFQVEFNWALKLKPDQGLNEEELEEGRIYKFEKEGYRIYPIDIPIDLINQNWEGIAKVVITKIELEEGKTLGSYRVLEIYSEEKKKVLTENWRKTVEYIKGEKIDDFSKVKVT